jgi:hypothetical protein
MAIQNWEKISNVFRLRGKKERERDRQTDRWRKIERPSL